MGTIAPSLIEVAGLSVQYLGTRGTPVVSEVSLVVESGQCIALLGPNGSGKTSLMKAIAGLLPGGISGAVRLRGQDFLRMSPRERSQKIVYVPDEFTSEFPISVFEAVALGGRVRGLSGDALNVEVQEVLRETDCVGLAHRPLGELSHGERQRAGFAKALMHGAKVVLLDESFSAMDLKHQLLAGEIIHRRAAMGVATLIVGHDLALLRRLCPLSVLLEGGKVRAACKTEELFAGPVVAEVFGVPVGAPGLQF